MIARLVQYFRFGIFDYYPEPIARKLRSNKIPHVIKILQGASNSSQPLPLSGPDQADYDIAFSMFEVADKYDVPDLRKETVSVLVKELGRIVTAKDSFVTQFTETHTVLRTSLLELPEISTRLAQLLLSFSQSYGRAKNEELCAKIDNVLGSDAYLASTLARLIQEDSESTINGLRHAIEKLKNDVEEESSQASHWCQLWKQNKEEIKELDDKSKQTLIAHQKKEDANWKRKDGDARTINRLVDKLEKAESKVCTHETT